MGSLDSPLVKRCETGYKASLIGSDTRHAFVSTGLLPHLQMDERTASNEGRDIHNYPTSPNRYLCRGHNTRCVVMFDLAKSQNARLAGAADIVHDLNFNAGTIENCLDKSSI